MAIVWMKSPRGGVFPVHLDRKTRLEQRGFVVTSAPGAKDSKEDTQREEQNAPKEKKSKEKDASQEAPKEKKSKEKDAPKESGSGSPKDKKAETKAK